MKESKENPFTVIHILTFFIVGFVLWVLWFGYNFAHGDKNPEYYDYLSNRINFSTVRIENKSQWDALQKRIYYFFDDHNEFNVPDSVDIIELNCIGCTYIEKLIYFQEEPIEVYEVTFDMNSFNHVDRIYKLENNEFISYKTTTLSNEEKVRIEKRLRDEVLIQIDWDISNIKIE